MKTRMVIWMVACFCSSMIYCQSQQKPGSIWDQSSGKPQLTDQRGKDDLVERLSAIPMEGPVDPNQYIVGPSDIFALTFWGVPPLEYTLPVTPEGTLLIPTVGEVRVAGIALTAARRLVLDAVEKRYRPGSLTMTLMRPRAFIVNLRGVVSKPGQYNATAIDRVDKIISQGASVNSAPTTFTIPALSPTGSAVVADDFKVPKLNAKAEIDDQISLRHILLIRRNGDTLHVDIPKFYATHENRYDPFLLDGDIIIVPSKSVSSDFVSINGAITAPGRYEYVEGDSLLGLVRIAQGFLENADRRTATLYRSQGVDDHPQELSIDLQAILTGKAPDAPLERGDHILIQFPVEKRRDYHVTIAGEVASPGIYPITRESTKLSHLIKSAGGITERALLTGSVIWRKTDKNTIPEVSQIEYLTYLRAHQFGLVDSNYFFLNLKLGRQPVVVHFKELLTNNDSSYDVTLRQDDYIYIASNEHSVLVQGQVGDPGYIPYVPGADYRYYIRKAGDYQELADEGEVRIIKGATMSWFKPGDTMIESGDRIWVPKESKKTFMYYYSFVRDVATLVISMTTLILVARK
jgi:polysaccharide biosynthesis/export protein